MSADHISEEDMNEEHNEEIIEINGYELLNMLLGGGNQNDLINMLRGERNDQNNENDGNEAARNLLGMLVNSIRGRREEQNEVIDNDTLARFYCSLFNKKLRSEKFLKIFSLCFNGDSYICSKHPRPVVCNECLQKYIKNSNTIIDSSLDDEVVKTYKDIILPRLLDLSDLIVILEEEAPMGTTLEEILLVMDIDPSPYDPPSQEIMDKCEKYIYVKKEGVDDSCTVCQCDIDEGDCVKKLVCGDLFHDECVNGWLVDHSVCPNCRHSLK